MFHLIPIATFGNSFENPLKLHWTSIENPLKICFLTGGTVTSQQFDFALASVGRSTHHQIGGSAAEVDRFGKCLLCSGAPIVWIYVEQHVEQYVEKYVDQLKGLHDWCIILYGCFNDMFNHISISCQSRCSKCLPAPFGPASLPDQELKWLTVFQNPIAGAVFQIPMDSDSNWFLMESGVNHQIFAGDPTIRSQILAQKPEILAAGAPKSEKFTRLLPMSRWCYDDVTLW